MIDCILAVIILVITGWAIAKNYDAKVVLFAAGLVMLLFGPYRWERCPRS